MTDVSYEAIPDRFEVRARIQLERAGFYTSALDGLDLPQVEAVHMPSGAEIPYLVMGDPGAASIVFKSVPYSTGIEDPSQQIRLAAEQKALGDDFCVVGLQTYHPEYARINRDQRRDVKHGSLLPFAVRYNRVIDAVSPSDDQAVYFYGFSRGADEAVETAYQTRMNPNFGIVKVKGLGAFDCSRTDDQIWPKTIMAFNRSGDQLFDNVVASNSPALLEANGIDLDDPKAKKKYMGGVTKGVIKYATADIAGNLTTVRAFSHQTSAEQIIVLSREADVPEMLVGRLADSLVCTPRFLHVLRGKRHVTTVEKPGDHSSADNLTRSAAFLIETVENAA